MEKTGSNKGKKGVTAPNSAPPASPAKPASILTPAKITPLSVGTPAKPVAMAPPSQPTELHLSARRRSSIRASFPAQAQNLFPIKLLTGSSDRALAEKVAAHLQLDLADCITSNFSNGETRVEIRDSCRGVDAYVIQPVCQSADGKKSVNDMLMELLIMVSALKGASAKRITAVMPIYGYARQDKKDKSRAAISARLVADLLEKAGIDRAMTVDLHASQIQGFFTVPMDNLYAEDMLCAHMEEHVKLNPKYKKHEIVIVSPDAGGAKRATRVAHKLLSDCAIISKERLKPNEVSSMRLVGQVKGKIAIVVDDIADTCGTLCLAAETLVKEGAITVFAYVAHGVLSGPAISRINSCDSLTQVVVTNTIPQERNLQGCSKLRVVDISSVLAESILCTHTNSSISALFKDSKGAE